MAIECPCSGCGQRLSVADDFAGRQARCPTCGQIYTVPYPNTASHEQPTTYSAPAPEPSGEFWMRSSDGTEYGPVDRQKLTTWFGEGRVGQDYQIRQGATGIWQPADVFRPKSSNPFAEAPSGGTQPSARNTGGVYGSAAFRKPDPSGLVLSMGILGWLIAFTCLPIGWVFAFIAVIQGRSGINDIRSGAADPTNLSLVQVGYWLGLSNLILHLFGIIATAGFFALALIG